RERPVCSLGALGCAPTVQRVRPARSLRAPPRIWASLGALPVSQELASCREIALAGEAGFDALDRFLGGGAGAEGRQAEVALAARPEARARRPDHVGLVQELVEELPRG